MTQSDNFKRYLNNWQEENEAVFLYTAIAQKEEHPKLAEVYHRLAAVEARHAAIWEKHLSAAGHKIPVFKPGLKTRILTHLVKILGAASVVPMIAGIERNAANTYAGQPESEIPELSREEQSHARIFSWLAKGNSGMEGGDLARFEGRHSTGGNALRAGVLGANDGLISVFCLVMGVAGAGVGQREILITGGAGLLAGALSMALGEWLSVQSSRELYENQIKIEAEELENAPEEERVELALIYQAKGMDAETAKKTADHILSDKARALDTLAREELGIDPKELGGSSFEAAITSFFLFAFGALFPVVPYFFAQGTAGILASAIASTAALVILGMASALITGKHWLFTSIRQVLVGWAAAGITFGLGWLLGVNITG